MDKSVRVNFYQVSNVRDSERTLFDAIIDLGQRDDRDEYTEVFQGVAIRIERIERVDGVGGGFITGDLVRQQSENLPPIARANEPLRANNTPLGHRSAFRYFPRNRIIALEANRQAVSPARLNGFIKARLARHRGFYFDPCLTEDAFQQLVDGTPRKISMRVARPTDLRLLEGDPNDLEANLGALQEMVGGSHVTVEVGFGRGEKDGRLNLAGIRRMLRFGQSNRASVEALRVKTLEEPVPIDLFGQQMTNTEVLSLDNEDVDAAYNVRFLFLSRCFEARRDELERIYGD